MVNYYPFFSQYGGYTSHVIVGVPTKGSKETNATINVVVQETKERYNFVLTPSWVLSATKENPISFATFLKIIIEGFTVNDPSYTGKQPANSDTSSSFIEYTNPDSRQCNLIIQYKMRFVSLQIKIPLFYCEEEDICEKILKEVKSESSTSSVPSSSSSSSSSSFPTTLDEKINPSPDSCTTERETPVDMLTQQMMNLMEDVRELKIKLTDLTNSVFDLRKKIDQALVEPTDIKDMIPCLGHHLPATRSSIRCWKLVF